MATSGSGKGNGSTQVSSQPRRLKTPASYDRDRAKESDSERMARDIVQRRIMTEENSRILKGNYVKGKWFDAADRYIGDAKTERSKIRFVRPRSLKRREYS